MQYGDSWRIIHCNSISAQHVFPGTLSESQRVAAVTHHLGCPVLKNPHSLSGLWLDQFRLGWSIQRAASSSKLCSNVPKSDLGTLTSGNHGGSDGGSPQSAKAPPPVLSVPLSSFYERISGIEQTFDYSLCQQMRSRCQHRLH